MPYIIHGSRVYQYRSKNKWKECWLSLEQNGLLNWKRKDAFLPLASIRVGDIVDKIKIESSVQEITFGNAKVTRPFVISIPMHQKGSCTKFAFTHGPDMELWLDAFATVVNAKCTYKGIKQKLTSRVASKNLIADDAVENLLAYEDLIAFYKTIWHDFLANRNGRDFAGPDSIRVFRTKSTDDEKENQNELIKYKKESVLRFSDHPNTDEINGNPASDMTNGNAMTTNNVNDRTKIDQFVTVISIDHYVSSECCDGDCIIHL